MACSRFQVERDLAEDPNINEKPPVNKKSIAEGKLELLTKPMSFSKPIPQPAESSHHASQFFFFYRREAKLVYKRTRMIMDKKISDSIFDI